MNFNDYQIEARKTAIYPDVGFNLIYPTLGLNGEAGEVAEKVKKLIRDNADIVDAAFIQGMILELGGVLWYISAICSELRISMDHVAEVNLAELQSRQERNVLSGSGDNR